MKRCSWNDRVDDYVLGRMDEAERERIEAHYFECPDCFRAVEEKDALIRTLRARGQEIFAAAPAPVRTKTSALTLRPWLSAAAVTAVFIAAAVLILGYRRAVPPQFTAPTNDTVRGLNLAPVGPVGSVAANPAVLEWQTAGPGVTYKITLQGAGVDWSAQTAEPRVVLPDDLRRGLRPGVDYTWQVRAFAEMGFLTGISPPIVFRIAR